MESSCTTSVCTFQVGSGMSTCILLDALLKLPRKSSLARVKKETNPHACSTIARLQWNHCQFEIVHTIVLGRLDISVLFTLTFRSHATLTLSHLENRHDVTAYQYLMLDRSKTHKLLSMCRKICARLQKAWLKCWHACRDAIQRHVHSPCGIKFT